MNEYVGTLFQSRNQAHIYHLQTPSYAKHMALNDYYEDIIDIIDDLCYKRDNSSIWKGLYEFPNMPSKSELVSPPEWVKDFPFLNSHELILDSTISIKHQLSHRTIFAKFWVYQNAETNIVAEKKYLWLKGMQLSEKGIPQLIKKFILQSETQSIANQKTK